MTYFFKSVIVMIYIMKNNGSLQEIKDDNDVLPVIKELNKKICDFIKNDEDDGKDSYSYIIKNGDISLNIFHTMRWRRCTGYLAIQKSNNGIRFLCYLDDTIKHHGQSFGTSVEFVSMKQVKDTFLKEMKNIEEFQNNINIKIFNKKFGI